VDTVEACLPRCPRPHTRRCVCTEGISIGNILKPFDMLAVTNEAYRKEKAARGASDGFSEIWLPFVDALRNAFAAPSEDMLGSLVAMQDMVSYEDSALVAHRHWFSFMGTVLPFEIIASAI